MKLSYRWLSELVDLSDVTPEQVAHLLTFHTAEIEDMHSFGDELDGVVTAKVTNVEPHPDADRLTVCTVEVGDATHNVVCGAPNVAAGQMVCYAPAGVTVKGPDGPITLEKRKVRGVESSGMICAEDELGLGDDHSGIIVLDELLADDLTTDVAIADALDLRDTILELSNIAITHRPDLWGHVGFARELGALLRRDVNLPDVSKTQELIASIEGEPFPVAIDDEEGCRRYVGVVMEGLSNRRSPLWLRRRLETLDVRAIDLLVDLTNLVLLEQGQPLHAFDLRDLSGNEIRVRRGNDGETMRSLDGLERTLTPDDVVIADADKAVAVAGVMGGENSGMRDDTQGLLLEAATFDPVRIRRTAQRLTMRTEASSRFEKSLDPELAMTSALRFAGLVLEHVPGAKVSLPISDCYPRPYPERVIDLPYALVRRRLGFKLGDGRIRSQLKKLGFETTELRAGLRVTVPSWRATKDIEVAEDLVEEVGRVSGYDEVPVLAPVAPISPTLAPPRRTIERRAGTILSLDLGYAEVRNYSFYGGADTARAGIDGVEHLMLRNALSEEQDRLIQTTVVNLLGCVERNQAREATGRLWESGRLFPTPDASGALPDERRVIGMISWNRDGDAADAPGAMFLELMADVRSVLKRLHVRTLAVEDGGACALAARLAEPVWLHPGRNGCLRSGERVVGVVGEVAPSVVRAFGLKGRVAVAELDLDAICDCGETDRGSYAPVLRYPVVPFDVSIVVPRKTPAATVEQTISAAVPDAIRNIRLFDAYEGENIPEGHRSLAFTCELFDANTTLSSKAAERLRKKVIGGLEDAGWTVRTA